MIGCLPLQINRKHWLLSWTHQSHEVKAFSPGVGAGGWERRVSVPGFSGGPKGWRGKGKQSALFGWSAKKALGQDAPLVQSRRLCFCCKQEIRELPQLPEQVKPS